MSNRAHWESAPFLAEPTDVVASAASTAANAAHLDGPLIFLWKSKKKALQKLYKINTKSVATLRMAKVQLDCIRGFYVLNIPAA